MVRLYRSLDFFDKKNVLYDNEGFFNGHLCGNNLSKRALEEMLKIDKAKLIDVRLSTIRTPFGVCHSRQLSSGCKTIINLIYIFEHKNEFNHIKAINATECGSNALDELFNLIDADLDIGIILEHKNNLENCKDRDYIIDDTERIKSLLWM